MSVLIYNHTFFGKAFKMSSLDEGYYEDFHRDYYDGLDLHCEEIFDEIEKNRAKKMGCCCHLLVKLDASKSIICRGN